MKFVLTSVRVINKHDTVRALLVRARVLVRPALLMFFIHLHHGHDCVAIVYNRTLEEFSK